MRKFVSILALSLAVTATAFAGGGPPPILPPHVPEPEVISLLGIGALAFLVAHRLKK